MAKTKKTLETIRFLNNDPQLPVGKDHIYDWTPEMIESQDRCYDDIIYFAEKYFKIIGKNGLEQTIQLYDYQKEAITDIEYWRYFILLQPRQSGKTTIFSVIALHSACFKKNYNVLIAANKGDTAKMIFKRIVDAYIAMPNWLKPSIKALSRETLSLDNGSSIKITKTSPSMARGDSINLLIIDEMAFIEKHLMEEAWRSVYPVISGKENSKILCSSTPNGTKNLFYEFWSDAQKIPNKDKKREEHWGNKRVYWQDIPGQDEAWKQREIAKIGSVERFNQEFGCEFFDSSNSGIDSDTEFFIKSCIAEPVLSLDNGAYKIWETPQTNRIYVAGVDIGEGVSANSSVVEILDITDLNEIKQVAEFASNTIPPYEFTQKLYTILKEWGNPLVGVERNSIGAEVVSRLTKDYKYPYLISYTLAGAGSSRNNLPGIISHTNTKNNGIMNQRYWLNSQKKVKIRSALYLDEIKQFVRHPNGAWKGKGEYPDDRVMAMVWALIALESNVCENYFTILEVDKFRRPAKIQMAYKQMATSVFDVIRDTTQSNFNKHGAMPSYIFSGGQRIGHDVDHFTHEMRELNRFGYEVAQQKTPPPKLNKYGVDMGYILS